MERQNAWKKYSREDLAELEQVCTGYKQFLNIGKTERECVQAAVSMAKEKGYRDLLEVLETGGRLQPGDKVYRICMNKTIALFQIGQKPLPEGMRILGAHIDSPRLDLKQNPLYEDTDLAYLDTHYYGGVKKYQWVTLPLAIHGVVAKKDGSVVSIAIGEDEEDPVFCVTDLLIHLSADQLEKKARFVIEGEALDVLSGSRPLTSEDTGASEKNAENPDAGSDKQKQDQEAVKAFALKILKEKYDMDEEDFLSAELEVVPAWKARDMGFDRSMVAGYGQDDRICAYTSLAAMLEVEKPTYTTCCLLVDKEEIGSVGATGMHSRFFENTIAELLACLGQGQYADLDLRNALRRSKMFSCDVAAAYDPLYGSAFEKKNSAYLGRGLAFNKYTGARGKSHANDANAEYIAWIRNVLDENHVCFQTAEVGKVDQGGGGTIAYISSVYGMDIIDGGVAILSMHAPLEVASKADIYEAKKGYAAFLRA